jgi:hypothetical protein
MKKITFLFAMLLLATISFAQTVIYSEDFESGGASWTDQNLGDGDTFWAFDSGIVPGSAVADFPTLAAVFDDDSSEDDGQHDYRILWHGSHDVSSYVNVTLNYEYALNVLGDGLEELTVNLWDNANTTWIPIVTYSTDTDPTADSIDVSAAILANPGIDSTALFFGFGYNDLDGGWAWGAGVDNIELTGELVDDKIIRHTATAANTSGNLTIIDHPLLNGNPSAIITVSHNWEESGMLNENRVGVWYDGSNWTIFNEDISSMSTGLAFNVYIAGSAANAYTHIATAANTSAAYTVIDDASVNGDPNAIIVLSTYWNPNGIYNPDHYGLFYDGNKWTIYNEENNASNAVPMNSAFNVVLAPDGTAVKAIQHQATAANTTDYWTEIDNALLNGNPDANFVFTHNWGEAGDASNVIVENTQSIWYNDATSKWRIFNDDISNMNVDVKFNILVMSDTTASVVSNELLSFNIFPNPVKDVLNVQSQDTISKIAIYNIMGQEVRVLTPNSSNLEVDLSGLDAGVYVIKVLSNDKEMSKKFIKK